MSAESQQRHPFDRVAEEFTNRYRRGEFPSVEDYADRHPELADEIRELFPALQLMEHAGRAAATGEPRQSDTSENRHRRSCDSTVPEKIGRFDIRRVLGSGGFGVVFEANDPDLHRRVALKVPHPEVVAVPQMRNRFVREAEAAAALDHPGIVPVYESSSEETCYIASAFVDGRSLAEVLMQRVELFSVNAAVELMSPLAEAVHHAHSRGVLHRDLKPANILIDDGSQPSDGSQSGDVRQRPRITDFGLARFVDAPSETNTNAVMGTAAYMAPEQAEGRPNEITTTADIHALGAILYELLTGRPPFLRETTWATLLAVRSEEPVPPSRLNARIPRDVDAVCLKCLEKSPDRRYPTAIALRDDLLRIIDGEPVSARVVTRRERFVRWCRRNPTMAGLIAGIALLLVLLVGGSLTAAFLLDRSREEALGHLAGETDAKLAAITSERYALRSQYDAVAAQAELLIESGQPGQRVESLRLLQTAAEILHRLDLGASEQTRLRSDFVAALSLPDVEFDFGWDVDLQRAEAVVPSPDGQFYAVAENRRGSIWIHQLTIHRTRDGEVVRRLPEFEQPFSLHGMQFSPDGSHLACVLFNQEYRLYIWEMESGRRIADVVTASFDFHPDGDSIVCSTSSGTAEVAEFPSMKRLHSVQFTDEHGLVRFRPNCEEVAAWSSEEKTIEIRRIDDGELVASFSFEFSLYCLEFDRSGQRIAAVGSGGVLRIWNVEADQLEMSIPRLRQMEWIAFDATGRYLAARDNADTTLVWDIVEHRKVLEFPGAFDSFSPDGQWLLVDSGRYRFHTPSLKTVLLQPPPDHGRVSSPRHKLSIHPDGRLLVASGSDRCIAWDLQARRVIDISEFLPAGALHFSDNGRIAIEPTQQSLIVSEIVESRSDGQIQYGLDPLREVSVPVGFSFGGLAVASGSPVAVVTSWKHDVETRIVDVSSSSVRMLSPTHERASFAAVTADGSLAATATESFSDVWIWDVESSHLLQRLASGRARVAFEPDGRFLAVNEVDRLSTYEPRSGRLLFEMRTDHPTTYPPAVVVSRDGSLLAAQVATGRITLRNGHTFQELAELVLPESHTVDSLLFTPDGTQLIATTRATSDCLYLWNLGEIRRHLRECRLDWDADSPLPIQQDAPPPIGFEF